MGYSPWGPKESDTTEQLSTAQVMLQQNFTKRREMEMGTAWPTSGNTELHQSGPTYLLYFLINLFLSSSSIVHFSLLSSLPFSPGFQRRNF